MLAIYLTDHLESFVKHQGGRLLYYFCNNSDNKRNTVVAVLSSWVYQLLRKERQLFDYVKDDFEGENAVTRTVTNLDALWRIFTTFLQHTTLGPIICVLDGLDECEVGVGQFIRKVDQFCPSGMTSGSFKLLVISRDRLTDGEPGRGKFDTIRLHTDATAEIDEAIKRFISSTIKNLTAEGQLSAESLKSVEDILRTGSEGRTFLWVGIVARELRGKNDLEVQEILGSVPRDLEGIYRRMLETLSSIDKERERQTNIQSTKETALILQWLTLARRPLTLRELADIVNFTSHSEYSVEMMKDRLELCGLLLKITKLTDEVGDWTVGFVHQSAKDYLQRFKSDPTRHLEDYFVQEKEHHLLIAEICVNYIEKCFTNSSIGSEDQVSSLSSFRDYSIRYWPEHLRHARDAAANRAILHTCAQNSFRDRWWKCYWDLDSNGRNRPTFTLLHLAAYFDIRLFANDARREACILPSQRSVNKKDNHNRTPISWAAERGSTETAETLISKGADIEAKEVGGGRPLTRAIDSDREDFIKLLLNRKAEIDYSFKSPYEALEKGDKPEHVTLTKLTSWVRSQFIS
jgi:hypothetical protein